MPEEVLRTEIHVDGRSPVDGRLLTAGEYAALQEFLADDSRLGEWVVNPELRHLVELLRLRHTLRPVLPFLP
ncbi:MAG: glutathione S-transferase [Pseudanabaenaceae cyanobacterium]